MPGWSDPTDGLGLSCPWCSAKHVRPVVFATTYNDAGNPEPPRERWFICGRCGCKFRLTWEDYWERIWRPEADRPGDLV